MPSVTVFENINFGGRSFTIDATTGNLTGWEHRSASSLRVAGFPSDAWICFMESAESFGDDQLYVQGNGELANLLSLARPHGDNTWNDRIAQIIIGQRPAGDHPCGATDNQTILFHGSRTYINGSKGWLQLNTDNANWGSSASNA